MKIIFFFLLIVEFCCIKLNLYAEEIFFWKIDTDKKIIFLTFDDGPSPVYTSKVLEILDEFNIKATFFVLGKLIAGNHDLIKKILEKGHSLGTHTYYHNNYYQLQKKYDIEVCKQMLEKELQDTEKELKKIDKNLRFKYLRMPHGFYRKWMEDIIKKYDYKVINWTFGYDWNDVSEDVMFDKYCKALQPGAIFLFHDGGVGKYRERTVRVLRRFILYSLEQGYRFGNLEEWLKK